jgi:hypothetical protein
MVGVNRPLRIVTLVAALIGVRCDGCGAGAHQHEIEMCGKCVRSSDCRVGLECVNATCETVPPSCHVQIGL